ncbi:MAG TPA: hypothetical protein VFS11_02075 [Gemmatimonadales bacterium]|nr:hypothetical protein [Gemmatimonadales bacterium]
MPLTPVHCIPGLLLKAAAPRRFSFTAFVLTQVVVDLESAWAWLRHTSEHPVLHTFLGGLLAGLACGALVAIGGERGRAARRPGHRRGGAEAAWGAALLGGGVGGLLHVLLDALVREGRAPFEPFAAGDPLFGLVSLAAVNALCIAAGVAGAMVLARRERASRTLPPDFTPSSSPTS